MKIIVKRILALSKKKAKKNSPPAAHHWHNSTDNNALISAEVSQTCGPNFYDSDNAESTKDLYQWNISKIKSQHWF